MTVVCVPLTQGQETVIDQADEAFVRSRSWQARPRLDGRGFYAVAYDGTRLHRALLGIDDRSVIVDHRNGDGLDNRRCNIRPGTQSGNCVNRQTTPGPHLRGIRPKKGRWQAYIKFQGKQRSLGYFLSPEEAHAAYLKEARALHGDWMPLPDPPKADKAP